jgi:predicted NUDIX family NTP pyrophosphohydrolase
LASFTYTFGIYERKTLGAQPDQDKTAGCAKRAVAAAGMTTMPKVSAGILLFRRRPAGLEVMLVHPGGPFWAKKDHEAWSIPKGLADEGEDLLEAAKREFLEETGMAVEGAFLDLGAHKQPGGKTIVAWGCEGDFDPASLKSNTFSIEWPPRSGRMAEFPEVDRAAWYSIDEALMKINKGQKLIIAALEASVTRSGSQ